VITVVETALIGLFLDITPKEMANPRLPIQSQAQSFDSKVIELKNKGLNTLQIAKKMEVHHQIISNVLKGVYDIEKSQTAKHRPSKFDWNRIDQECSNEALAIIKKLRKKGIPITKRVIAKELKLKDASLRNLPKLLKLIKKAKATSS
jgi:transcriptional regulator